VIIGTGRAYGFRITVLFGSALRIRAFWEIYWHFSYTSAVLHKTRRNDWRRRGMNPLYRYNGSDSVDSRIWINPEMESNGGSLFCEATKVEGVRWIWCWWFALSECSLVLCVFRVQSCEDHLTPLFSGFVFIQRTHGHIKTAKQRTIIQQYDDWNTGRWWVCCYIWYSKEGPGGMPPCPVPSSLYQM